MLLLVGAGIGIAGLLVNLGSPSTVTSARLLLIVGTARLASARQLC